MGWGSRLRSLAAASWTCWTGDSQKRERPPSGISQPLLPPSSQSWDFTTKLLASHKHCLTHSATMSAETQGVRVTGGCHEGGMFSLCSGERFGWKEWVERNTGGWWCLAADFISLLELIFTLVLKMRELRELGRKRTSTISPRWQHQVHWDRWEEWFQPRFPLTTYSEDHDSPVYSCKLLMTLTMWTESWQSKFSLCYRKHLEPSSFYYHLHHFIPGLPVFWHHHIMS